MIRTKKHALNVIAKRRRLMIEREGAEMVEPETKVRIPRKSKPDFIVRIESGRGERVQVSFRRFMGKVFNSENTSVRQFCRGLENLITKSA